MVRKQAQKPPIPVSAFITGLLAVSPWQWPELTNDQIVELSAVTADGGPEAPLFQYDAVCKCNALKPEIDESSESSGFAVLLAVRICGNHGLAMPEWLSYAFARRFDTVLNCRAISWDDLRLSVGHIQRVYIEMLCTKNA